MQDLRKIAKVFIGSETLALFLTLLTQALSLYGLIDVLLARVFLTIAWLVAVLGILVSDYLCEKSWKHVGIITLTCGALLTGGFFWLDRYVANRKAEQEAALLHPLRTTTAMPSLPRIPIKKTDWSYYKPQPLKMMQLGGRNNAQVGTISQGPGSIAQIGGSNNQATIINKPPDRELSDAQTTGIEKAIQAMPESLSVFVKTLDGNAEAYKYADQFQQVVKRQKREGNPTVILGLFWRPTPVGLMVVAHSEQDSAVPYSESLLQQMQSLGINAEPKVGTWVPKGSLYIVVGVQP